MKLVVITEKPHITKIIAPQVLDAYGVDSFIALHAFPILQWELVLPKGLRWSDYPLTQAPAYQQSEHHNLLPRVAVRDTDREEGVRLEDTSFEASKELPDADVILYACDPDPVGSFNFQQTIIGLLGVEAAAQQRPALLMMALDSASIAKAIARKSTFPDDCSHWLEQAKVKRYFDFNYTINSLAIFGRTLARIPSVPENFMLSKYALQVLYFLSDTHTMSESHLLSVMYRWPGSGKYPATRMGSVISQTVIIERLHEAGLIQVSKERHTHPSPRICISEAGRTLLSLLHPDCEDPDLPARLEQWMGLAFSEAQPKMDRYLRTFFGKQKRFIQRT